MKLFMWSSKIGNCIYQVDEELKGSLLMKICQKCKQNWATLETEDKAMSINEAGY